MGEFRLHHVRFFDYQPLAIHCLAYDEEMRLLALSRSDNSVEIWSVADNWFQERIITADQSLSVEALVWLKKRLFSAGLTGDVIEYDLLKLASKAGTEDGCVVLFDVDHGVLEYMKSFDKQEARILSIAWHVDEEIIVTGGIENIRLWNVQTGCAIQRLTLGQQNSNKETIVWCIAITRDMTLVTGDSRGKTCFWRGKEGTLIKSFQSHKADVLCLCVNEVGDCMYCSGVDPALVCFKRIPSKQNRDKTEWVRSGVFYQRSHDVRSVVLVDNHVVTGGIDSFLIINRKEMMWWCKIGGIPHRKLVHTAKASNIILLQYSTYLEVWKLGSTGKTSGKNGEILPLQTQPIKLLQLKAKNGRNIICSAISSNAELVAFSDHGGPHLYSLKIEIPMMSAPCVTINRIRLSSHVLIAHCLIFSPDGTKLVLGTNTGTLQVVTTEQPDHIVTINPPREPKHSIYLLAINKIGNSVAVADNGGEINVYNIMTQQLICSLPSHKTKPSAMAFHPDTPELAVAYSDQLIYEFDVRKKQFSNWCIQHKKQFVPQWLKRSSKIINLTYNPRNPNQLFIQDEKMFCILDKTQYLLLLDCLQEDWLLAVEKTPMAISEAQPPALYCKKFGS